MRLILTVLPLVAVAAAFQYVRHEIATGGTRLTLPQAAVVLSGPVDLSSFQVGLGISDRQIKTFNADNIARQVQENTERMQQISAYMRSNPATWHGLPPH